MFAIRDQERKLAQEKREAERTAPVHAKHTHSTRISHLTSQTRRLVLQGDDDEKDDTFDLAKVGSFQNSSFKIFFNIGSILTDTISAHHDNWPMLLLNGQHGC